MLGFLSVISMGHKIFAMTYMEPYIAKTKIEFHRMTRRRAQYGPVALVVNLFPHLECQGVGFVYLGGDHSDN